MNRFLVVSLLAACGHPGGHSDDVDASTDADDGSAGGSDASGAPYIVADNFATASALPGGTRRFSASVTFSEPVTGVAHGISITSSAWISDVTSSDDQTFTFDVNGLRNQTAFDVRFGAEIHDLMGVPLVPTSRQIAVAGQVLYVVKGGRGTMDGTSPDNAMPDIYVAATQAAASPGTDIWVAAASYTDLIRMSGDTGLYGGFDTTFTERDPQAHVTTVTATTTLLLFAGGDGVVDGLTLTSDADAVHVSSGTLTLSNDTIAGSYAIYFGGATVEARANTISGSVYGGRGVLVNNVVRGPVYLGAGIVTNNTLDGGTAEALAISDGIAYIANNILSSTSICVDHASMFGQAAYFENNAMHCPTLFYSDQTGDVTTLGTLAAATWPGTSRYGGNLAVDPALDSHGRPTTSAVTTGGRDTSGPDYASVSTDRSGAPRTVPVSIGAFEVD